jgi:hypothetical protein
MKTSELVVPIIKPGLPPMVGGGGGAAGAACCGRSAEVSVALASAGIADVEHAANPHPGRPGIRLGALAGRLVGIGICEVGGRLRVGHRKIGSRYDVGPRFGNGGDRLARLARVAHRYVDHVGGLELSPPVTVLDPLDRDRAGLDILFGDAARFERLDDLGDLPCIGGARLSCGAGPGLDAGLELRLVRARFGMAGGAYGEQRFILVDAPRIGAAIRAGTQRQRCGKSEKTDCHAMRLPRQM